MGFPSAPQCDGQVKDIYFLNLTFVAFCRHCNRHKAEELSGDHLVFCAFIPVMVKKIRMLLKDSGMCMCMAISEKEDLPSDATEGE